MRIVLGNMEKSMIYEFAVVRGRRRERHFADGHSKGDGGRSCYEGRRD